MSTQKKRKIKQSYLLVYLYMIFILMSLFTVASYTWFSLSQTPRVSDMNMYVTTQTGLELSATPKGEWVRQLDFVELVDETTPLRPVTWSEEQKCFYAAAYGMDGRLLGYDVWKELNDESHTNKTNADGYYIKVTFYARTGQATNVVYSPAVEVSEGVAGAGTYVVGKPVWKILQRQHENAGLGAEYAVRLGLRATLVDENDEPLQEEPSELVIYEPNADHHMDGSQGFLETPSMDGTPQLTAEDRIIRQSLSSWSEQDPPRRNNVLYDLGEFQREPRLFHLEPEQIMRLELYIWLEGQDADCINGIHKAQLIANIQFAGDLSSPSGIVPIGTPLTGITTPTEPATEPTITTE